MPNLSCRFYSQKYPEVEDVVMVNVRSIAELGAYVHLLEYNNIEGMILKSELSRRRIRSINKLIRVGKTEPVIVVRVDKEKGYIDLSKRRVTPEEAPKCTERYSKAKAVNSILRHVAALLKMENDEQLEELYEKTAWRFERKTNKQGSSYDFFKAAVNDPAILDECELDPEVRRVLYSQIKQKLTLQAVKIRTDVEVSCFGYEGIDAVKKALKAGMMVSKDSLPIKVNLIAPPLYVITTQTPERQDGLDILQESLDKVQEVIEEFGGNFKVNMAPTIMTETDEADLQKAMERAEQENLEVAGDSDEEEAEAMRVDNEQ